MSDDCYCDHEPPEWMTQYVVKSARKPHQCCECNIPIAAGESYEYISGKWDGNFSAHHTCLRCIELRQWATISTPCFCYELGNLHDGVREMVREVARDVPGFFMEYGRRMVKIRQECARRGIKS